MLGAARTGVDRFLGWLCIIVFVALVAIVAWQVFTREVLNDTAPWTQEAAQYSFVVLAMIAAAYVFSERGHIAVEILIEKLPMRSRRAAAIVIELIVVFFIVSIAGVLILFYSIVQIIGILAGVEKPTPDANEISEAI